MSLGQLAIPTQPYSQQKWEAQAKKTLLTHEEGTMDFPLSSNYPVKLRSKIDASLVQQIKKTRGKRFSTGIKK